MMLRLVTTAVRTRETQNCPVVSGGPLEGVCLSWDKTPPYNALPISFPLLVLIPTAANKQLDSDRGIFKDEKLARSSHKKGHQDDWLHLLRQQDLI